MTWFFRYGVADLNQYYPLILHHRLVIGIFFDLVDEEFLAEMAALPHVIFASESQLSCDFLGGDVLGCEAKNLLTIFGNL